MYTAVMTVMLGLSVVTNSADRLLLTAFLYYVLEVKSDKEEIFLTESYGSEYTDYQVRSMYIWFVGRRCHPTSVGSGTYGGVPFRLRLPSSPFPDRSIAHHPLFVGQRPRKVSSRGIAQDSAMDGQIKKVKMAMPRRDVGYVALLVIQDSVRVEYVATF